MSKFELGKTYKLENIIAQGMQAVVQAKFKGEVGVFTVHELKSDGGIYTDDITSPILTTRCTFPAEAIDMVEEVTDASTTTS